MITFSHSRNHHRVCFFTSFIPERIPIHHLAPTNIPTQNMFTQFDRSLSLPPHPSDLTNLLHHNSGKSRNSSKAVASSTAAMASTAAAAATTGGGMGSIVPPTVVIQESEPSTASLGAKSLQNAHQHTSALKRIGGSFRSRRKSSQTENPVWTVEAGISNSKSSG